MHFSIIPCSGSKARQMCPYFQIAPLNLPCHSHPGKWRSFGIGTPPEFCNDRVSFLHFIKTIITFPHLTLPTGTISTVNLSVKWTVSETRMWARLTHNGAHLRLNGDHNKMKNPKKREIYVKMNGACWVLCCSGHKEDINHLQREHLLGRPWQPSEEGKRRKRGGEAERHEASSSVPCTCIIQIANDQSLWWFKMWRLGFRGPLMISSLAHLSDIK